MKTHYTSQPLKVVLSVVAFLCAAFISNEMSAQLTSAFVNQSDLFTDEFVYSIVADSSTNAVYACGSYQNASLTEAIAGISNLDGTITRLDNSGNIIWTNYISGTGNDEVLSVCVGRDGNIYITGYYSQIVTLSTISGTPISLTNLPAGNTTPTAYVASYTPAGALRWAVRDGGSLQDIGMSIASTSDGVVAIGSYCNRNAIIQGTSPQQNLNSTTNDMYIVKYGFGGNPLWYMTGGSSLNDYSGNQTLITQRFDICSYNNQIVATGMYNGTSATFSGINGNMSTGSGISISDPDATEDGFILSLENNGNIQWAHPLFHGAGDIEVSVAMDCEGIYLGGNVTDFIEHENGNTEDFLSSNDLFISRYSLSGSQEWTKVLISPSNTNTEFLREIITDYKGNIFFTGEHSATLSLGNIQLPTASSEIFVAQYDNEGNYVSHQVLNGSNTEIASTLCKMGNGKILVAGISNSNLDANQLVLNTTYDAFAWGLNHSLNVSLTCCTTVQNAGNITTVNSPTCLSNAATFVVSGYSSMPTWQYSADGINYTNLTFTTANITYNVPFDGFIRTMLNDPICGFAYSQPVSVNVQETPIYTCNNADRVIELTGCSAVMPNFLPAANTTCPTLTFVQNYTPGVTIGVGTYPIQIRDWNGNLVCSFNLRVEETNRPGIVCPSTIFDLINIDPDQCGAPLPDYRPQVTIFDECPSSVSLAQTPSPGTLIASNTLVEITATDLAGNTSSCQFIVAYLDQTPPVISNCPTDAMVYVDQSCSFVVPDYLSSLTVTDNCDTNIEITQMPAPGTVINTSMNILIKATDDYGNISSCSPFIFLRDTIAPVIAGCPNNVGEPLNANCEFVIQDYTTQVTASDNCGIMLFYQTPSPGTVASAPTVVSIWAIDSQDNYTRCEILVTGMYSSGPIVNDCPNNPIIYLDENCLAVLPDYTGDVTLLSNCLTSPITQIPAAGTLISSPQTVELFYEGMLICSFTVQPLDTLAPIISAALMDQALPYTIGCSFILPNYTGLLSASDNCSSNLIYTQTPPAGSAHTGVVNVTLSATDQSGNSASIGFNVTGIDVTAPTLSCPSNKTLNASASCTAILPNYLSQANANDQCDASLNLTQTPAPGSVVSGITTVTIRATDDAGLFSVCSFTVTVIDNTPPIIANLGNQTVALNANCEFVMPNYIPLLAATDNCDNAISITQNPPAGTIHNGITNVQFTAIDDAGNSSQIVTQVIPVDGIPPSITCPGNRTVFYNSSCGFVLPNYTVQSSASDNCSTDSHLTFSQSPAAGTLITTTTTVIISVTDENSNSSSCTFVVTPIDNISPILVCPPNQTINLGASCNFILNDYRSLVNASDNCTSPLTLTQSPAPGTLQTGTTIVTISCIDGAGNNAACTFSVLANDTSAPSVTCPANQTLSLGSSCSAVLPDYTSLISAFDNCDATLTISQTPAAGTVYNGEQTQTIFFTITDDAGNTSNCSFLLSIEDNIAPILNCPSDQTLSLDNNCSAILPDYRSLITVMDNCDGSTLILQNPAPGTALNGPQELALTLTIFDDNGNSNSCSLIVSVIDQLAPTIICPTDQTSVLNSSCEYVVADYTGLALATDNCTDPASIVITQTPIAGTVITAPTSVTITATDNNGNSATCQFIVQLQTNNTINISCPIDQTIALDNGCSFVIPDYTNEAVVSVSCGGSYTLYQTPAAGTISNENTAITLTATSDIGQVASCTFFVQPIDMSSPNIICPVDVDLPKDENCEAVIPDFSSTVIASDNCTIATFVQFPPAGTIINSDTPVTIIVTDASGLSNSCVVQVYLSDTIAPSLTCPPAIQGNLDAACEYSILDYTNLLVANDNCSSNISFHQSILPNTIISSNQTITFSATDEAGNFSTCSSVILTIDTITPSLICPSDRIIPSGANCEYAIPNLIIEVIPTDNCFGSYSFTQEPASGIIVQGQQTVTISVSDETGNTATCAVTLITVDNQPPTITACMPNTTVQIVDCIYTLPSLESNLVVSDNCDNNLSITQTPVAGSSYFLTDSIIDVLFTVTDGNGNTSSCASQIVLVDTIAPSIVCPSDTILYTNVDNCLASFLINQAAIEVSCENIRTYNSITSDISSIIDFPLGEVFITYYAEDEGGNTSTCVQNIIVLDSIAPIVTCNDSMFFESSEEYCGNLVILDAPTVFENCTIASINSNLGWIENSPNYFDVGVINFIWEVADQSGNIGTCETVVTITDMTAPVIECDSLITGVTNEDVCNGFAFPNTPIASDNCGVLSITSDLTGNAPFSFDVGTSFITYIATDIHGNSSTCITEVRIDDIQAPEVLCPAPLTVEASDGCSALVELSNPLVTDNCSTVFNIVNNISGVSPISQLFAIGTTSVEYIVFDQSGQSATCITTITVVDVTLPILDCESDIELFVAADDCFVFSDFVPMATDICGNPAINMMSGNATHLYSPGDYTEIWQAIDEYNNSSTCEVNIHVLDITPPNIVCPNDTALCATVFEFETPVVTDNCTGSSWIQTDGPEEGQAASPGSYTIQYTAIDNFGLTNTCSFQYEVTPLVDLTVNFLPDSICSNAEVTDLNPGVNANSSYSFDANAPNGLFDPAAHATGWVVIEVTAGTGACAITLADSLYIHSPIQIEVLGEDVFCGLEGTISLNALFEDLDWNLPANVTINPLDEISFTAFANEYGFYTYDLTGIDQNGCLSSGNFSLNFEQNPSLPNAGPDQTIFQITETLLNGNCDPLFDISWTTNSNVNIGNPTELNTSISNLTIGTHLFILTNATENCGSLADSIYIVVRGLEIPSGFSPNNDGTNDYFVIPGIENEPASLSVFNRWGKEVWKTDLYKNDWDGKDMNGEELQEDTYFYELVQNNEQSTGFIIIKRQ